MKSAPLVFIIGPTASGKSDLALALAERIDAEIVSIDSAQVYQGMDIGTAKPDANTRARIRHHLIDLITPLEAYSAARFRADALSAIDAIRARGRVPLLVGGTMLYVQALLQGLSELPVADATLRAALEARAHREGWPALHAELARIDPATAARLAPGDAQRIQRALEVHGLTGRTLSDLQGRRGEGDARLANRLLIGLMPADRAQLHQRIGARFHAMLDAGLLDELRALRSRYRLGAQMASMRAVGYRQAFAHLEGTIDHATLVAQGIAATRQLAKRQLTWMRGMPQISAYDPFASGAAAQAIAAARAFVDRAG
ncbi:MAG TPA: tRNA (adenosine(37)-N6)-dimethylallyltransferase MiaA [Usitatibacteraceae bacterium]|nr:tRNA (adenosine(37)-N6)-dimethylallyltransferase MiaA [Usitatibacteraceae bacterium]